MADTSSGIYNAAMGTDPSSTVLGQQAQTLRPGAAISGAMGDILAGLRRHKQQMAQQAQQQPQPAPPQAPPGSMAWSGPPPIDPTMQSPMGGTAPMTPMGGAGSGGWSNALFSPPPSTGYGSS